jgi:endo-1,4-beta-xylanase
VSAAPAVAGRKTCEAYIANIVLDGKIDDAWNYAPEIPVTTVKENASKWFGDKTKVAGKDYAELTCKVLWDGKDKLYILYIVKDKVISLAGANPWEKDSIEYFIQVNNSTDKSATKIQKRMMADNSSSSIAADSYGYARTTDGFIYEIEVDVKDVGGAGQYLGIDFQYNDDAEGKGVRNICLGWSDSTDKASSDPSVYGQCLLSNVTVAELKAKKEAEDAKKSSPATSDPLLLLSASSLLTLAGINFRKRRK